jgi:hypothetical protein
VQSSRTAPFLAVLFAAIAPVWSQAPTIGGCSIYPQDHVWNTRVDHLPVHPNSATYIQTIGPATGLKADFGSGTWNGGPIGIPFVTVPGTQTRYPATFLYWDESDPGPYAIPLSAPIEGGPHATGDRHAIALDTTNCVLYELYRAFPQANAWKADSGAIYDLRSYALRPATWTSADAAGLPILPGLVRYDEVAAGAIRHAIRFTVPQTQRAFIWPARHYASSLTDPRYPPMGLRVRLKATFDITPFPADVRVILQALKTYGMILADNGSPWFLSGVPDERWNNSNLRTLANVIGSNLEAVDTSSMIIGVNSGQARQPGTPAPQPAPVLSAISPTTAATGNIIALTATGSGFVSGAVIRLGTQALATTFVSASELRATGSVTSAGTYAVTVANPDGQISGARNLTVSAPQPVKVTISPTSTSVRRNRTRQFSANVQNTTDKRVVWQVNGVTGGNATVGTISSTGLFRAPGTLPNPATVTVRAVSVADTTKSASATVTITR